ncbi:LLM class flavin-dependent oxidoreductase [Palleronia caenipelagi]|uniref:Luciferase-like monooxygenase n=1 Tax=Palleronia caenipelagi TaxID=2489174 RepID=A0A547QAV4_9RHOB|nr:LLM class flavin-dependent oxidoreductase [Palleronia caenipelagi]TRD23490.1 LLM class flavin-dependent oxidoreductase [Palleronia caenipelagi]
MRYSILDLAHVTDTGTPRDALEQSIDLARHAEKWSYHRFWLAEHHSLRGVASSATAVMLGQIAAATNQIRVGSGGIMLPNHAPLVVAEAFGTLETLYPGRIDLGLGRAPGGDMAVIRALRRGPHDDFQEDVQELQRLLGPIEASAKVRAVPGEGTNVPIWILGSSLYGASLAAQLGLPYAFASHFAPDALEEALTVYRQNFRPSAQLDQPHAMVAVNVFAAESRDEARYLRSSAEQSFANLVQGRPSKLPAPVADITSVVAEPVLGRVQHMMAVTATGTRTDVSGQLASLIDWLRPDELILTGAIHDHAARLKSFRLASEALADLQSVAA